MKGLCAKRMAGSISNYVPTMLHSKQYTTPPLTAVLFQASTPDRSTTAPVSAYSTPPCEALLFQKALLRTMRVCRYSEGSPTITTPPRVASTDEKLATMRG